MKLSEKVSVFILTGTFLSLFIVGISAYLFTKSVLSESIKYNQMEITHQTMNEIDRLLYERLINIQAIAGETSFETLLLNQNGISETDLVSEISHRMNELSVVTGPWDSLFAVNKDGEIVLSTEEVQGKSLQEKSQIKIAFEAAMQDKVYYSDQVLSDDSHRPTVIFAAPITVSKETKRQVIGAMIGNFSWPAILQIIEDIPSHVTLVNREGTVIAHNLAYDNRDLLFKNFKTKAVVQDVLKGQSKSVVASKNDSILQMPTLASLTTQVGHLSYRGSRWGLILETPTTFAYAPATKAAVNLVFLLIPVVLIEAFLFWFTIVRLVTKPLAILSQTIEGISAGDLTKQAPITSQDEIGELSRAFNKMVSDLKRSTVSIEVLEKEQKRFQDVAMNTGDWIWEVDAQGRYTYSSPLVEKILGYKPEEVIGKYFYDFFHPDDCEELKKGAFEAFAKKEVFKDFPSRNIRKDGRVVILETSGVPLIDADGKLIGYRGADRDVTERKKAEEEREALINELKERQELLNKQKQEVENSRLAIKNVAEDLRKSKEAIEVQKGSLEDINKELDDFTYIISHDLKEPLRSIDAFSKFIADDCKDKVDEQGRFYIERVRMNASRMQNLIEDLLEISHIERKKNIFEEVEAEDLIDEVKLRLEYRIKEKNARIAIHDKLPRVYCDRVRLTEVFANLFSNALKFNDKPEPLIEIGSSLKDGFQEFYVKDNGPGIEEQYFDKIFEIFQRLNKREDNEGTGAGLTIVKKIIQMHKGKIWLESKVGEFTTFYFTIPTKEKLMSGLEHKKIGEILVEKKLVTEAEVKKALEEQEGG